MRPGYMFKVFWLANSSKRVLLHATKTMAEYLLGGWVSPSWHAAGATGRRAGGPQDADRQFPRVSSKPILCPRSQRHIRASSLLAIFSHVRIFVNSSRMGCSVSLSILLASEGISVVASSAVSGVRVPRTPSASPARVCACAHQVPSSAFSTVVSSGCVSKRAAMECKLSSCL
jgi:hypothetical protein